MKAKAPRLEAYLEYGLDTPVIISSREQYELLNVSSTDLVEVNIQKCPFPKVSQNAAKVAIIAKRIHPSGTKVSLYRHDQNDYPEDWNVDHYVVEETLS